MHTLLAVAEFAAIYTQMPQQYHCTCISIAWLLKWGTVAFISWLWVWVSVDCGYECMLGPKGQD